jgi:hypothetical protein
MGTTGGTEAMSEFDVSYQGLDEFSAMLRGLPDKTRKSILRRSAQITENLIGILLRRSTQSWSNQPRFDVKSRYTASSVSVGASTSSEIYPLVDEGTRPHIIEPRGEGYPLRFSEGYKAKTSPGVLYGYPGGPTGGTVRAMRVRHPGTRARRISQGVMNAALKSLRSNMEKLWSKAFGEAVKK